MMFRESRVRLYCAVTPSRGRPARAAAPAGGGARARAATSILSDSYSFRLRSGPRARSRVTAPRPVAAADTSHAESCGGPLTRCE